MLIIELLHPVSSPLSNPSLSNRLTPVPAYYAYPTLEPPFFFRNDTLP
jgi:hypothetical protein